MGLIGWLKEPGLRGELLRAIYGDDSETALVALERVRKRGWLDDMSMRGVDLTEANLPGAHLKSADLKDVVLRSADLTNADLTGSNLREADLERASMQGANLAETNLQMAVLVKADLTNANLTDADLGEADLDRADLTGAKLNGALLDDINLYKAAITDKQLEQAQTLAGATMPDGNLYDGRFNLPGDLIDAEEAGAALDDPDEMAEFYGVPVGNYQAGQVLAAQNAKIKKAARKPKPESRTQFVEVDDRGELPIVLGLTRLTSYVDLMDWPFKNRDEWEEYLSDWDNAKTARTMAGWLASTLLWLPLLILHIPGNILAILRSSFASPGALGRAEAIIAGLSLAAAIFVVGWVMTALAFRSSRSEGVVFRIIAFIAAFLSFVTGSVAVGLTIAVGAMCALVLAYLYGSRAARLTVFWVSSLLFNGSIALVLGSLGRGISSLLPNFESVARWILIIMSILLVAIAFALGVALTSVLRTLTRDYALKQLSRQKNSSLVAELRIAYFVGLSLLIFQLATNSFLWPLQ